MKEPTSNTNQRLFLRFTNLELYPGIQYSNVNPGSRICFRCISAQSVASAPSRLSRWNNACTGRRAAPRFARIR